MSHVTDQRRRARRSRCGRLGGLFAVAVAVAVALFAPRARSAPETFRDIQVEVIGNGRPLLMIPGLNSAGSTWTETCAALQPGVQCHIVQLPGFAGLDPTATPETARAAAVAMRKAMQSAPQEQIEAIAMSERGYHFLMWDDAAWLVARVKGFLS